jgi:phosphopentomutase
LYRRSYSPPASRIDPIGPDDGGNKIESFDVIEDTTSLVSEFLKAVEVGVAQHPAGPNFSMLHIRDTDSNGHAYGWGSAQYMQALALADTQISNVLDTITSSAALQDTVVIVTTDHGGLDTGHFDTTQLDIVAIPFFVWGNAVPKGADLYAVSEGRTDPGQTIPMDAIAGQPIRNGDAANFALDLMGLPPIEGSLHRGMRLRPENAK